MRLCAQPALGRTPRSPQGLLVRGRRNEKTFCHFRDVSIGRNQFLPSGRERRCAESVRGLGTAGPSQMSHPQEFLAEGPRVVPTSPRAGGPGQPRAPGLPQGPAPTHSRSTPAFRASRAAYFAHDIWGLLGVRGKSRAGSYPSKPGASLKTLLRPEQRKEKIPNGDARSRARPRCSGVPPRAAPRRASELLPPAAGSLLSPCLHSCRRATPGLLCFALIHGAIV